MPARKPNWTPGIGFAVLTVLIGGYVGAYYAMVHATGYGEIWAYYSIGGWWPEETFGITLTRCQQFFSPIHWLDRHIRPHIWEPTL
jgi:hypothetical protein